MAFWPGRTVNAWPGKEVVTVMVFWWGQISACNRSTAVKTNAA